MIAINTRLGPTDWMIFIDDSGDPKPARAVYGALMVRISALEPALAQWLAFRQGLADDPAISIPVSYELHAHKFIPGRGNPSRLPHWNRHKINRRHLAQTVLDNIATLPGVNLLSVHSEGRTSRDFAAARTRAFDGILRLIDRRLTIEGTRGRVVIDGDGTDPLYAERHHALSPRSLPAPPRFAPAHASHWLQMADFVAYSAHQAVQQRPGAEFMWGWYARHLPKAHGPEGV
ncbi:DUF3800 domain-containing protein [Streptomyces sp. SID3343]|uniref:DUF3800 domain-containing protein n=1 Tax=Streptomyces sp. SID3343 TaxID=2690260 RepID=UPI00137126E8|nr:DUF3800 domain-containing protein [Streptomyces sp. SID3343]MYW04221.1 DUF3800 domain-containing protein [Streptomyces sp. SID3343]